MKADVLRLYPEPRETLPLNGLYLQLGLHRIAPKDNILIYANFIASLDGRISLKHPGSGEFSVPSSIANQRDWRLYQELAAQSDVMITSGRYFRQLARGYAQDLLPVGKEAEYADLQLWRKTENLKTQPDVAIVSASLDIPLAALDTLSDRNIHIFTRDDADPAKRKELTRHGANIIRSGRNAVDGSRLCESLVHLGYHSAYMIAGPGVHHTLVAAGMLDRLFVTSRHMLLGGYDYHTFLEGDLAKPVHARLETMYLDTGIEPSQIYAQYLLR